MSPLCNLMYFSSAWTSNSSHLPVCGGHMSGGRRPPGPKRIPTDVSESLATQRPGGSHHLRPYGSGPWAQLWRYCQELRLPRHKGAFTQTDTGQWSFFIVFGLPFLKKPTSEGINPEFWVILIRCVMCLQEMLGLMKPATSGQQGKPLAPHDAAASCRYEIISILPCEIVTLLPMQENYLRESSCAHFLFSLHLV